ncbi:MAG: protein kinase domain-containing protein, partial [Solirubrobacteraceae bacterium]
HLADFGISATLASTSGVTRTGCWVGSLDYVAPEVIQGDPATERSDVYSLGCVLYEMLSGTVPYPKASDAAKLFAHLNATPPAIPLTDPREAALFTDVVACALAKDPDLRYQTPHELAAAAADQAPAWIPRRARRLRNRPLLGALSGLVLLCSLARAAARGLRRAPDRGCARTEAVSTNAMAIPDTHRLCRRRPSRVLARRSVDTIPSHITNPGTAPS